MRLLSPTVRVLVRKELRQVRRSKGALASATLLPLFLMTGMPLGQLFVMRAAAAGGEPVQANGPLPPGMAEVGNDPVQMLVRVMLPLFLALGGLMVPSVSASYTIVAEREKRSLELVMALPARVGDILVAKLVAMLALAIVVVLPLFAIDMAVLLALGLIGPLRVAALLALVLAALACSVGVALLLALLARDFRTANNLNGAFAGPLIVLMMAVLFLLPSPWSYLVLGVVLVALTAGTLQVGLRWLTFERYLA